MLATSHAADTCFDSYNNAHSSTDNIVPSCEKHVPGKPRLNGLVDNHVFVGLPGGAESYWLTTHDSAGRPNCQEPEALPHQ
jgi:hypothetical protein